VVLILLGGARTCTRNAAWADTEAVFATLAEEHPESFRAQWWMGQALLGMGEIDRGIEWLRLAGETNPNELRIQLDYVRGLLLARRSEEAYAIVSKLPLLDPARAVYLTQSLIQLNRPDEARAAVLDGLARFPGDARLQGQAVELGVAPESGGEPPV
jgi:tetratricopeptide (TPR) repeat protein